MGLYTMRYRAAMIGGSLELQRDGARGTVVTCSFPSTTEPLGIEEPASPRKAKILLVEDHQIVRQGASTRLINQEPDMEVAAEAGDARAWRWPPLPKPTPDLVIADISLPRMNGIELVGKIF